MEVVQPDSKYFERILFFVKPEYFGMSEGTLRAKADAEIKQGQSPPPSRRRRRRLAGAVKIAAAAAGGAVLTAVAELVIR